VAARIRTLEEDLGVPLLVRSGRTVKPTEAGRRVLEQVRSIVATIGDLRAAVLSGGESEQLRIGCFFSGTTSILRPTLEALYATNPELSVFVDVGYSSALAEKVIAGQLDAALVIEHQFNMPKSCEWHRLTEEALIVLAPGTFDGSEDAHHLLRTEPYIHYDTRLWGGRLAARYLREHGISPRTRLEIDGLMTIASFVSRGFGISLLPDWAPMWSPTMSLTRISLPGPAPTRRIGILSQARGPLRKVVAEFVRQAKLASAPLGG
jgi:DNA-binding transcriptional LysR family regulator